MLREALRKIVDRSLMAIESVKPEGQIYSFGLSGTLGHSGAKIFPAICKDGPYNELEMEATHLESLGPEVAVRVFMFGDMGNGTGRIVMESMGSVISNNLLTRSVETLDLKVWFRPPPSNWDYDYWRVEFFQRFGFDAPDWLEERHCLIHGDPTLANTFFNGERVRYIDPKTPSKGIPPFASVDLGKIMQSWLGWERALYFRAGRAVASDWDKHYAAPHEYPFMGIDEETLRRATFWCMIHCLRIVHREGQTSLGWWAARNVRALQETLGMNNETIGLGPRWNTSGDPTSQPIGIQVSGHHAT